MEGEDQQESVETCMALLKGSEYVVTNVVQAVRIVTSRNAVSGAVVVSEQPVCGATSGNPDEQEANGLKLHDRIVAALQGHEDAECVVLEPGENPVEAVDDFQPVLSLLATAAEGRHCGIHAAYRVENPQEQACTIADQVLAHGRPVVLISDIEANSTLISLIVAQVRGLHARLRRRAIPTVVVPDEWDLVSAASYDPDPMQVPAGETGVAPLQYDVEIMGPQKRLLYITGGQGIAPVLWAINGEAPVSRGLVRLFSDIAPIPHDREASRVAEIMEMASHHGIGLDSGQARRIAGYTRDPSELAGAFRRAGMSKSVADLDASCRAIMNGSRLGPTVPTSTDEKFDIRLVSVKLKDINPTTGEMTRENTLEGALRQFVAKKNRPISVLLYGPSGTSKSALARHMADRMDMEVLEVRPSQIFGKWVGDAERALAKAFDDAQAKRRFLLLDEVDSFLSRRELSATSWEKSLVNEFLTQMQRHPLPMACTTNFVEKIDPAAIRRFMFKIESEPLDLPRSRLAWTSILGLADAECPADEDLDGLTVSDFAIVANKMAILEIDSALYARSALREERATRGEAQASKIGFLAR